MLWNRHYSEEELIERLSKLINKGFGYRSMARRLVLRHFDDRPDYTPRTLHQMMLACLIAGDYESAMILRNLALKTRVGGGIDNDTRSAIHRDTANSYAKRQHFARARWEIENARRVEHLLSPASNVANQIVMARIAAIQGDFVNVDAHLDRAEKFAAQCLEPIPQYLHNIAWVRLLASSLQNPSDNASRYGPYYTHVSSDPSPARRFFGAILVSKLPRKLRSLMAAELLSH